MTQLNSLAGKPKWYWIHFRHVYRWSVLLRFALGIMPYISASIVVQLELAIPYLQNFKVMARVVEKD
jgi:hypothetical protein